MLKSGLFRNAFTLVLVALLLFAALTMGIFLPIARREFSEIYSEELTQKANYLSTHFVSYLLGLQTLDSFKARVGNNSAWGAQAFIFYGTELEIYTIAASTSDTAETQEAARLGALALAEELKPYAATVLESGVTATTTLSQPRNSGYIVVGVPIIPSETGFIVSESGAIGSVFMAKPLTEVNTSLSGLTLALLISMFAVLILMLLPSIGATRFLVKPINQMKDVSLAMAAGNFSVRASTNQNNEIGELGSSLNFLAERLSTTINALQVERNRLELILNGLSEGIAAVDSNGALTLANPALLSAFGLSSLPENADRLALISDPDLWADFDNAAHKGDPLFRNFKWGNRVYRVMISPLESEADRLMGAVGIFHDITESERLEQTRREYVANVSHELRTPVAAIRGFAEALNDGMVKEEARQKYYCHILRESMRLSRLIDDLLELSRLQSGAVAFEKAPVDTRDLLLSFVDCYHARANEVGIELRLDLPENCPPVFSNADRIDQVLVILFDNALKFTPEGGAITLGAAVESDCVVLSLTDTGCGIAKDDLPHVFDRFFKADKSHTGGGTGLGLSIAREIMQLLGERIWVTSEEGKGTRFCFTLRRVQTGPTQLTLTDRSE